MNLNLPVQANDFVRSLVAQGKYQSEEDVVVDGIRLLKGSEELREKMAVGTGQLDRGELFDEEAVFDEVEAEIRRIESSSHRAIKDRLMLRLRYSADGRVGVGEKGILAG